MNFHFSFTADIAEKVAHNFDMVFCQKKNDMVSIKHTIMLLEDSELLSEKLSLEVWKLTMLFSKQD